jgi:hypothetical protein
VVRERLNLTREGGRGEGRREEGERRMGREIVEERKIMAQLQVRVCLWREGEEEERDRGRGGLEGGRRDLPSLR